LGFQEQYWWKVNLCAKIVRTSIYQSKWGIISEDLKFIRFNIILSYIYELCGRDILHEIIKIYCTNCVILVCSIICLKPNYEFLKWCCTIFCVFYKVNYKICNIHVTVSANLRMWILSVTVFVTRQQNRWHCYNILFYNLKRNTFLSRNDPVFIINLKFIWIIFKIQFVPNINLHKVQALNRLIWRKSVDFYSEIHTKRVTVLCGQNSNFECKKTVLESLI